MSEETKGGIKFDGTISVPTLVAAIGVACSFIWSSMNATDKILEMGGDLKGLKIKVDEIAYNVAAFQPLSETVKDHEGRLRAIEARLK